MAVLISWQNDSFCKGLNSFLRLNRFAQSEDALQSGGLQLFVQVGWFASKRLRCYYWIDSRDRTLKIKYDKPPKQPLSRTTQIPLRD